MCFYNAKLAFPAVIMAGTQIINTNDYHQRTDDKRWMYSFNFAFRMKCFFIAKILSMDHCIVIMLLD